MRHNGQEPDDTRQMLAEGDLLSEFTQTLRDILEDDTTEPPLEGEAAFRRLLKAARDREPVLGERQAAKLVNLKPATLARLRIAGKGPKVYPVSGGKACYVASALREWQTETGRTSSFQSPPDGTDQINPSE